MSKKKALLKYYDHAVSNFKQNFNLILSHFRSFAIFSLSRAFLDTRAKEYFSDVKSLMKKESEKFQFLSPVSDLMTTVFY